MKLLLLTCLYLLHNANAQTIRINGFIEDSLSEERLVGANVQLVGSSNRSSSNQYGFYSLSTKPQAATIVVSYVGYKSKIIYSYLDKDTTSNIKLIPDIQELQSVTVQSNNFIKDPTMGFYKIPINVIKQTPALLGEKDALKLIQTLPGVQAGTEGTAGLYVRGGSPDQNLILLDGIPVYNVFHLFGFFSVFNTDALSNIDFYKSHIPARYGGRLSSVIDITTKEGNLNKPHYSIGVSPVAGNFLAEGPIWGGRASYLITARRTWSDLFTTAVSKIIGQNNIGYNFNDINIKINYNLSDKERIYLSGYIGRDRFNNSFQDGSQLTKYQFNWGNYTSTLRYTKILNRQLFVNLQVGYTNYNFKSKNESRNNTIYFLNQTSSKISDVITKIDFDWSLNKHHKIKLGETNSYHIFNPNIKQYEGVETSVDQTNSQSLKAFEIDAYIEDEWTINKNFTSNFGYHQSMNKTQNLWYINPQPRISLNWTLDDNRSVKISYNYLTQYLHLLTNASIGLPTDLWVPSTSRIPPQSTRQTSLGYYQTFMAGRYRFAIEAYYKRSRNVLEYKEGSTFLNDQDTRWYDRVILGKGRSYGFESYAHKTTGRFSGWLSYTLSWNERQFSQLNQAQWFPYKYDRRHNLSAIGNYNVKSNSQFSVNFTYSTGNPVTIATSAYQGIAPPTLANNPLSIDFFDYYSQVEDLSRRNNFRLPPYHRLDVSYKVSKAKKHGVRTWLVACYNLYNRKNSLFIFYQKGTLKQFSLLPIIPSITYQYEF